MTPTIKSAFVRLFKPKIKVEVTFNVTLMELGSSHGGKLFVDEPNLRGALLVSGGAGEDITFDVEFASKYGAQVVLVDPVPRARSHFLAVMERVGKPRELSYSDTGQQSPRSYDLTQVSREQFTFISRALGASDDEEVTLFPPGNPDHVSYSSRNLQKAKVAEGILRSQSVSVGGVAGPEAQGESTVVKLDIEGVAYEVLRGMFKRGFFPRQIIVEIDEMIFPSVKNYLRARLLLRTLRRFGYQCAGQKHFDLCFMLTTESTDQETSRVSL